MQRESPRLVGETIDKKEAGEAKKIKKRKKAVRGVLNGQTSYLKGDGEDTAVILRPNGSLKIKPTGLQAGDVPLRTPPLTSIKKKKRPPRRVPGSVKAPMSRICSRPRAMPKGVEKIHTPRGGSGLGVGRKLRKREPF